MSEDNEQTQPPVEEPAALPERPAPPPLVTFKGGEKSGESRPGQIDLTEKH
jgi:hypothetical protein